MKEKTSNINVRIDPYLKEEADTLFKELGLNTSSAINMFLRHCVREQEIPFLPSLKGEKPNKELKEALKESELIEQDKIKAKRYNDVDKFIEDMLK